MKVRSARVARMDQTYGSLLDNNALDVKVLNINVLRIRVRLSVLEEAGDELDALLGPAT